MEERARRNEEEQEGRRKSRRKRRGKNEKAEDVGRPPNKRGFYPHRAAQLILQCST